MNVIHPAVIEAIGSVIENSEHSGYPLYEKNNYSGRGMYGANCYGLTCNTPLEVISMITYEVWDMDEEEAMVCWIDMMSDAQTDNMGLQQILYFPRYKSLNSR